MRQSVIAKLLAMASYANILFIKLLYFMNFFTNTYNNDVEIVLFLQYFGSPNRNVGG